MSIDKCNAPELAEEVAGKVRRRRHLLRALAIVAGGMGFSTVAKPESCGRHACSPCFSCSLPFDCTEQHGDCDASYGTCGPGYV